MNVNQKIKQLMKDRDIPLADLARSLGMATSDVNKVILGGRCISLDHALILSRLFDVSLEYLADNWIDEPCAPLSAYEHSILWTVRSLGVRVAKNRLLLLPDSFESPNSRAQLPAKVDAPVSLKDFCVYFMEDRDTLLIKIGRTFQIEERLRNIRNEYPNTHVLATIEGGSQEERELHDLFSRYRVKGEWFRPSPLIFEYIAANAVSRN